METLYQKIVRLKELEEEILTEIHPYAFAQSKIDGEEAEFCGVSEVKVTGNISLDDHAETVSVLSENPFGSDDYYTEIDREVLEVVPEDLNKFVAKKIRANQLHESLQKKQDAIEEIERLKKLHGID